MFIRVYVQATQLLMAGPHRLVSQADQTAEQQCPTTILYLVSPQAS